jgi:hypothetical protein
VTGPGWKIKPTGRNNDGQGDNTKARSLADPWIIVHVIDENVTAVTKEEKITQLSSKKTKFLTYVIIWVCAGLMTLNL